MKLVFWVVPLLVLLNASPIRADAVALEKSLQEAIKKAEPSIACILVSRKSDKDKADDAPHDPKKFDMSRPDYVPDAFGSGIVVDRSGLILTCAHVVSGNPKLYVRLPGGIEGYAEVHALDGRSDLAVIKLVDPQRRELKPATFGDGDKVAKGQFVVALSNPYAAGFRDGEPSASAGIVSNLRRRVVNRLEERDRSRLQLHHFATLIQADVRLNAGCSGGALVNLKGEVVGILTAQAALLGFETPGGFALPAGAGLQRIIDVLKRGEEVEYGFLGVILRDMEGKGVQIDDPMEQSPAALAGLRRGDYILSIGGVPVRSSDDIFVHIGSGLAGNTIEVERARSPEGPGQKVQVKLAKFHVPQPFYASKRPAAVAGLRVDYTSVLIRQGVARFAHIPQGVVIREVIPSSPADKALLQTDKIITHVRGNRVTTPAQFYQEMANLRGNVELTLYRSDGMPDRITLQVR